MTALLALPPVLAAYASAATLAALVAVVRYRRLDALFCELHRGYVALSRSEMDWASKAQACRHRADRLETERDALREEAKRLRDARDHFHARAGLFIDKCRDLEALRSLAETERDAARQLAAELRSVLDARDRETFATGPGGMTACAPRQA